MGRREKERVAASWKKKKGREKKVKAPQKKKGAAPASGDDRSARPAPPPPAAARSWQPVRRRPPLAAGVTIDRFQRRAVADVATGGGQVSPDVEPQPVSEQFDAGRDDCHHCIVAPPRQRAIPLPPPPLPLSLFINY